MCLGTLFLECSPQVLSILEKLLKVASSNEVAENFYIDKYGRVDDVNILIVS